MLFRSNIRHNSIRINLSTQKTGRTNEIPCNERPSRESPHTPMQIIETDPPSSGHYMPAGFVCYRQKHPHPPLSYYELSHILPLSLCPLQWTHYSPFLCSPPPIRSFSRAISICQRSLEQAARFQAAAQRHACAHGLQESSAPSLLLIALVISSVRALLWRISTLRIPSLIVLHALILVVSALLLLLWIGLRRVTALLVRRRVVVVSGGPALDVCGLRRGDVAWVAAIGRGWGVAGVLLA